MDILIFAIITIFLLVKLFSILGKQNDSFNPPNDIKDHFGQTKKHPIKDVEIITKKLSDEELLKSLDPNFSQTDFIRKAQIAYEIVINAYADNDTHALSDLVDIDIMRKLAYSITKREEKQHQCVITLFKNKSSSITHIEIIDSLARITVKIDSELIFYIKDTSNKIIKGSKTKIEKISQELCFIHDINNPDPTWKIEKINTIPF